MLDEVSTTGTWRNSLWLLNHCTIFEVSPLFYSTGLEEAQVKFYESFVDFYGENTPWNDVKQEITPEVLQTLQQTSYSLTHSAHKSKMFVLAPKIGLFH